MPRRGSCKACGAETLFLETYLGSKMPVDAEPVRVFVQQHGNGQTWYGLVDGYTSHLGTCPQGPAGRPKEETDGKA